MPQHRSDHFWLKVGAAFTAMVAGLGAYAEFGVSNTPDSYPGTLPPTATAGPLPIYTAPTTAAPKLEYSANGLQVDIGSPEEVNGVKDGVEDYLMTSSYDGNDAETIRVLRPSNPAPDIAHNILITLPVVSGSDSDNEQQEPYDSQYGDGLNTVKALKAQNTDDLTVVEPSFDINPWYADSTTNANEELEAFMAYQLVPWIKTNLFITGKEQIWLIGFSKSGLGGMDLLLKHPNIFTLAALWDFPDMTNTTQEPGSIGNYGTELNFETDYELTPAFLAAHAGPFIEHKRIWIGGYNAFKSDLGRLATNLSADDYDYTEPTPTLEKHAWDTSWVSNALDTLEADSIAY